MANINSEVQAVADILNGCANRTYCDICRFKETDSYELPCKKQMVETLGKRCWEIVDTYELED